MAVELGGEKLMTLAIHEPIYPLKQDLQSRAINVLYPPVPLVAATGDGSTDDTTVIQNIINSLSSASKRGFVLLPVPKVAYKITTALSIDISLVSVHGERSKIDASAITAGNAITLTSSAASPYLNDYPVLKDIEIQGNGKTGSVTGISISGSNANASAAHFSLECLNIHDFHTGISYGSNTYCIDHIKVDVWNCSTCFSEPSGGSNYGERMSFKNSTFFNSTVGLNSQNATSDWYFDECSFDYLTQSIVIGGCVVNLDKCHIEWSDTSQHHISISGGFVAMRGGWLNFTGTALGGSYEPVSVSGAGNGGITLSDVFVSNTPTEQLITSDGTGYIKVSGLRGFGADTSYIPSNQLSILPDPSFEKSNTAQISAINQSGTGTVAIDTTTAHTGTNSLKFTKPATGDTSNIQMWVPLQPGQRVYMQWYQQWTNVVVGSAGWQSYFVHLSYQNAQKQDLTSGESYNTGSSTGWQKQDASFFRDNQPPLGTAYAYVEIGIVGTATGTAWIDDFYINVTN